MSDHRATPIGLPDEVRDRQLSGSAVGEHDESRSAERQLGRRALGSGPHGVTQSHRDGSSLHGPGPASHRMCAVRCARRVVCVLHFVDDEPNPRAERTEDSAFHAGGDHQLSGRRAQLILDGDTDTRDLRRPLLPQRRTKVLLPHRIGIGLPVDGER